MITAAKIQIINWLSPPIAKAILENFVAKPVIVIPPITRPADAQAAVTGIILIVAKDKTSIVFKSVTDEFGCNKGW